MYKELQKQLKQHLGCMYRAYSFIFGDLCIYAENVIYTCENQFDLLGGSSAQALESHVHRIYASVSSVTALCFIVLAVWKLLL
jgi:hypothetical protein